ncbi:Tn3 family transposase post-transcriptional regulator TnpC [Herbaspirillum sp. RV1423]|uniref:Tn3 family transposase post-transcriptional regulator TnpC n=1 Tax=Herbaspirillum sp. RV1423 TaxID=1443993 RepID=UPI000556CA04|nr:Tn3 family transposase post-transcriptional regulator TnpC [Herbaspirillum sp. RV1423]
MSSTESTVATAYGRLDKAALEEARNTYDTSALLSIVDELHEMILAAGESDGLREMLLRLHGMAHSVINGAGLSVATDEESLPELAAEVISEVQEIIFTLQKWVRRIEPLEKLEAKH